MVRVLTVVGDPEAGLSESVEGRRLLRPSEKKQLLDALREIRSIADPHRRPLVVNELREVYGAEFDAGDPHADPLDALAILNKSLRIDAVGELVEILELFSDDDEDARRLRVLKELVDELMPRAMLRPTQRQRLTDLLADLPADLVVPWLRHPWLAGFVSFPVDEVKNGIEAARRVEELGPRPSGPPPLLVFLELVAHGVSGYREVELHQFIHDLEAELGRVDDVRRLCRQLGGAAGGAAGIGAAGIGTTDRAQPTSAHLDDLTQPDGGVLELELGSGEDLMNNLTTQPVARAVSPAVWGGVPPRNVNFTGRDDLVVAARDSLRRHHAPAALVPHAMYGLGGVGKTQLASEYAHRFQTEYDLVWWIPSDDERSVRRSLASLGRRLSLPDSIDVQQVIDSALDALRRDPKYARWLLVFDNAEEPEKIRPYLPTGSGHVLITSRNRHWDGEANTVEVDVFTSHESVALLTKRWKGLSGDDALSLAERLGHLPLALDQAVAVHEQTGMPLTKYLELFDESPGDVLDEGTAVGYQLSVAKTWRLAFDQLRERSAAAAQLLELCAFISSQPIAISMLTRGRGAPLPSPLQEVLRDELQLRRAVRDIGRYALAQLDPGRDFVKIHMLVRAVIRDGLPPEQRELLESSAHAVLALANPGDPDRSENWTHHGQITPHVIPSGVIYSPDASARQVVLDQVRYLYSIGDFSASRTLGELAVETWRASLGVDDPMTLVAGRHLGNSLRALGEYREARELDQDTLGRMETTLGVDHEHTLAVAKSVAADLRLLGAFQQAKALDEGTLERHRRVLGPDDPSTLRAANNLAVDHRLLGEFRSALRLDQDTRLRRSRVFGEDHIETLYSYGCLARDEYGLGNYTEALELQREKLRIHEQKLPVSDHGDLLYARRNLAILLRKTGHHGQALVMADKNFDVYRNRFGRKHEHTLAAMVTLCNTLRLIGVDPGSAAEAREAALARARDLGDEAIDSYRQSFGAEHPFTLACANNLGIVLRALELNDEAMELDERTMASLERVLGADHPYTLCAAANMTNNLAAAGRHAEARDLSVDVLARSRRVRIEDHPYTLAAAANLAIDLAAMGQAAESIALQNDTRDRLRRRLGPDHPETINVERGRRAESDIEPPAT